MRRFSKAYKKISLLFLALLLMFRMFPAPIAISAATASSESEEQTVSFRSPAIPANTGETVDLSSYGVMISESQRIASENITWSSDEITIRNGTVKPTVTGVYALTAESSYGEKTVYLVVKAPTDTEYVLYEETFDGGESLEALGYETIQCTDASHPPVIENGKLVLSAQSNGNNYIRVLLPEWLGDFGDYKIDTLATMPTYQHINRWMSIMFRVQNSNIPYYQFTQRGCTEADNGTELALRTEKDQWDVQYTAPYAKRACDGTYRTYSIEAYDSYIRTLVDGEAVITTSVGTLTDNGRIGFHVRACEMSIDKIRVTLQTGKPEGTDTYMATVEDPDSNIILPPSVIAEIATAAELDTIRSALSVSDAPLPATAIFALDSDLTANIGDTVLSLDEILSLLDERVIPAFRVTSEDTATALAQALKNKRVIDVFVLSDNGEILTAAREIYPLCRAVLDFSESEAPPTLARIREQTNACGARVCILPEKLTNKDNVEFLQHLLMTVWSTAEETDSARVNAIVSGTHGIIVSDFKALASCYTKYFSESSVIRPSAIIGHRGVPSLGQENTIACSMRAYELGATTIECDVHLSADNVVVVMHDSTLDRTTNGTGNVSDYTYAMLSEFEVDSNADFKPEPIPTLEDYFKAFKGLDVELLIEIKTSNTAICQKIAELIEKYEILNQVSVIAFGQANMTAMKKACPEVSVGYLTSSPSLNEDDPTVAVELILAQVQTFETTYNPSYKSGALGPNLIRAGLHRGITMWPWTINSKGELNSYFFYGTAGITTNYTQYISDCIQRIDVNQTAYSAVLGEEIPLTAVATTYDRNFKGVTNGELVLIEGDDVFTYENGILTAKSAGTATLIISASCKSPTGADYVLYTAPFTVTFRASDSTGGGSSPFDPLDSFVDLTATSTDGDSEPPEDSADGSSKDTLPAGDDAEPSVSTDEGSDPPEESGENTLPSGEETDSAGSTASEQPSDSTPAQNGGCGSVISASAAIFAAAALSSASLIVQKKKEKRP